TSIQNSDIDFYAAGVVQNIENAAMDLYVIYRHAEGDVTDFDGTNTGLDDFDMVITGARIQF
ncbi:MAG: porin, partial [Hyphomicrobium sp.]